MRNLPPKLRNKLRAFCISKPRSLWKRYVLGFAIIFTTISASHWASLETIRAAENDAEVLTVSSRQRMLSQRILFLMNEVEQNSANDPLVEYRLEAALDTFEASHNWLVSRPGLSPALQHQYFDKEPISLDAFSRRFIDMVGIAINSTGDQKDELHALLASWGKDDLISSLATAADLFRQESEARIARLQNIQQLTLIAALLIFVVEALAIFLPAQVSVNSAIKRLEHRKALLKKSLSELKQRNSELNAARNTLTRAANHDALTGLYNRRAVYELLNSATAPENGADTMLCVMKIDLDLFKQVNDTLGHNAGDQLLQHVADILMRHTGTSRSVGRIGGDEFVMMIENPPSVEEVEQIASAIIAETSQPVTINNSECRIGASAGYTFAVTSVATPDQMLIEADLALYEAKRAGRGMAFAYSDDLANEMESRRLLFKEITLGLSDDQFEPFLQPQVYTSSREIYGCEVLARWRHPQRGLIPPATFIAAAEEAGLVSQIDRIMTEKGLDLLEKFDAEGIHLPSLSVNFSPSTLRDPLLLERLLHEVQARHLSPRRLTVEVLESTLIENDDDAALKMIENLSAAGFAVVLDDFGTGYASMSNLSCLKLDGIKLDQSLIKPVPDPRADSIIAALVALSRNLDMRVVAEGVETEAHFHSVERLGCDVIQGFGIGRPMPADDFPAWVTQYSEDLQGSGRRSA